MVTEEAVAIIHRFCENLSLLRFRSLNENFMDSLNKVIGKKVLLESKYFNINDIIILSIF